MLAAVMSPIENLVAFLAARRTELGLSQREVAEAAGMLPGTYANLELGRVTKSPRADTLQKLARGLRVDIDVLMRIANGEAPESAMQRGLRPEDHLGTFRGVEIYKGAAVPPHAHRLIPGGKKSHPPTADELRVMAEAEALEIFHGALRVPAFWEQPPEKRRAFFRNLENLIDETRRISEGN